MHNCSQLLFETSETNIFAKDIPSQQSILADVQYLLVSCLVKYTKIVCEDVILFTRRRINDEQQEFILWACMHHMSF